MEQLGSREEQKLKMLEMAELAASTNGRPCKECFGRGFSHWDVGLKQYVPCICVTKAAKKIVAEKIDEVRKNDLEKKPRKRIWKDLLKEIFAKIAKH